MLLRPTFAAFLVCLGIAGPLSSAPLPVDYSIVYVRAPRFGDDRNSVWPEVGRPTVADPGADLVLLQPDGSEEVLVACSDAAGGNGRCAVTDPFVSFDGEWVYYSLFHDQTQRFGKLAAVRGADIYRIHLESRQVVQLTDGEYAPNLPGSPLPRYGIFNLGPCPLPGGRVVFTSNRNGFEPTKSFTFPTLQLFVMDDDGRNVEAISPMTLGSALHPVVLRDGRVMFSSYESQGLRDSRLWGLWAIYPDGRHWEPLVSAFHYPFSFHFQAQLSDGSVAVVDYYNLNNNGFGTLVRVPVEGASPPRFASAFERPPFASVKGRNGPGGASLPFSFPFAPLASAVLTPFTHAEDHAASCPGGLPCADADRVGKVTHPSSAPGNDLLLVWTPGPANDQKRPVNRPRYDGGIYLLQGGRPATTADELVPILNRPQFNEQYPRAVVPYERIYGVAEPSEIPWLPNRGGLSPGLPPGTPFGLVGSSSLYRRESFPGEGVDAFDGLDPFNSGGRDSSNWRWQGADAGRYGNEEIWAVRLLALEPNLIGSHGPGSRRSFFNHANERLRILGEVPVRKHRPDGSVILDPNGDPDTSFLVQLAADTPFTFQTLDRNGLVLNMAQTWHQVRPGEVRADCGGCHAHSQQPLEFERTAAAGPGYEIYDLSEGTPLVTGDGRGGPGLEIVPSPAVDVEFLRDIRPLLERSCITCHTRKNPSPPGGLILDDRQLHDGLPGDYKRLAADPEARWGRPPVTERKRWMGTNASRYLRPFQSRRSLLVWKIFGRRLDGWTNEDHPTERVPGDASTLPSGADPDVADVDFDGRVCPPFDGATAPLSDAEKLLVARWVDLGAPINLVGSADRPGGGWFQDTIRPTLTLSSPRPGPQSGPLHELRLGVADANSGIDGGSLSVRADFPVAGRRPGRELADLFRVVADGVLSLPLDPPIPRLEHGGLSVRVEDRQGNQTQIDRAFSVVAPPSEEEAPAAASAQPSPVDAEPSGRGTR